MSKYGQLIAFAVLLPWLTLPYAKSAAVPAPPDPYQSAEFRTAFFEAARVYGRGNCGDAKLAEMTARNAVRTGVPANLIASIVVVESTCNPLAINKDSGDIGIMQLNMKAQSAAYDFQSINPFNPERNMEMGSNILAASIKTYGIRKGIGRYNGVGPNMDAYSARVLNMAGKLPEEHVQARPQIRTVSVTKAPAPKVQPKPVTRSAVPSYDSFAAVEAED